ncbi:hypothetical protein HYW32_00545 [Candidatus Berkelbacteria bacterium]|nr:hypothetical protein [Candidatus Berkelbacteria bacterium]
MFKNLKQHWQSIGCFAFCQFLFGGLLVFQFLLAVEQQGFQVRHFFLFLFAFIVCQVIFFLPLIFVSFRLVEMKRKLTDKGMLSIVIASLLLAFTIFAPPVFATILPPRPGDIGEWISTISFVGIVLISAFGAFVVWRNTIRAIFQLEEEQRGRKLYTYISRN